MYWLVRNPVLVFAVVIPTVLWIVNVVVRSRKGLPLTAGADLLLLCLAFDISVLGTVEQFRPIVPSVEVANGLSTYFAVLLAIVLLGWLVTCFYIEPRLAANYDSFARRFRLGTSRFLTATTAWLVIWVVLFAHCRPFLRDMP